MKILHVVNQLSLGGTEKTAINFCQKLQQSNDVKLFSFAGGIRHSECLLKLGRVVLGNGNDLQNEIKSFNPNIIHIHRGGWQDDQMLGPIAVLKDEHKFKIVETNIFGDADRGKFGKSIDLHLFVSNYVLKYYQTSTLGELNNEHKLNFLYNPIKSPAIPDKDYWKIISRQSFGIPDDAVVFGRIGRPDNHHGVMHNAIQKCWRDGKKYYLICLCPTNEMLNMWKNNKLVKLVTNPIVDEIELTKFYYTIDGLLHDRTDGETFGCGLAEAMIHGVPCISHISRKYQAQIETMSFNKNAALKCIGVKPESIVFKDSRSLKVDGGFITRLNDSDEYARCIDRLLEEFKDEERTALCLKSYLSYDSQDVIGNRLIEFYVNL